MPSLTDRVAFAEAVGASMTLPALCAFLGKKGVISAGEIEKLRLGALMGFASVQQIAAMDAEETALFEKTRNDVDALWHDAVLAAEAAA